MELGELCAYYHRDRCFSEAGPVLARLPTPYVEIGTAAMALVKKEAPVLSESACDAIKLSRSEKEGFRRFRVVVDQYFALPVDEDIRWLLANTDDSTVAIEAVNAAIRRGMSAEVEAALYHRFAHVTAEALMAIAEPMSAPLPVNILAYSAAGGRRIREVLVKLLDAKPHEAHLPALLQLSQDKWSGHSFHNYDHDGDFPIAREAVAAIEKLGALELKVAEQLYGLAAETSDSRLRQALFVLLVKAGGFCFQERLFELAVAPSSPVVGRAAANALLMASEQIHPELVARITPELLVSSIESVAVALTLLLASRADSGVVKQVAQTLSTNIDRRLLVVLLIWVIGERDVSIAEQLTNMLPARHVAVAWARGQVVGKIDDEALADLGSPAIAAEVLRYMR